MGPSAQLQRIGLAVIKWIQFRATAIIIGPEV